MRHRRRRLQRARRLRGRRIVRLNAELRPLRVQWFSRRAVMMHHTAYARMIAIETQLGALGG